MVIDLQIDSGQLLILLPRTRWRFPGRTNGFPSTKRFDDQPIRGATNQAYQERQGRGRARIPRCVSQFNKAAGQHPRFDRRWRQSNTTSSNFYQIQPQSPGKVLGRHIARDEQLRGLRVAPFIVQRLQAALPIHYKIGMLHQLKRSHCIALLSSNQFLRSAGYPRYLRCQLACSS